MARRSTPTSPPIRRAPRQQIADTCWRFATSTARSGEGRWYGYSAQPDRNPWPGTPTRTALVVLRRDPSGARSWHELTIPADTHIEDICAEGSTFRIRANDDYVTATGDEVFRVIADCSFGPPGLSEARNSVRVRQARRSRPAGSGWSSRARRAPRGRSAACHRGPDSWMVLVQAAAAGALHPNQRGRAEL